MRENTWYIFNILLLGEGMYIIIIGCGKVGLSLAEQLSDENHDITLVDSSADKLQNLSDDLDAMKVLGNGASISTCLLYTSRSPDHGVL